MPLPSPTDWVGLYAIAGPHADSDAARRAALQHVESLVQAAPCALQLRDKHSRGSDLTGWLHAARSICRTANVPCIVNDRLDLALIVEADGVHLGQDDLPLPDARAVLQSVGQPLWLGVSTHTPDEIDRAAAEGADVIGFGPIFGTGSKPDALTPRGLDALRIAVARARRHRLPLIAIGGIDHARAPDVAHAGATIAAAIGALEAHTPLEVVDRARRFHHVFVSLERGPLPR